MLAVFTDLPAKSSAKQVQGAAPPRGLARRAGAEVECYLPKKDPNGRSITADPRDTPRAAYDRVMTLRYVISSLAEGFP